MSAVAERAMRLAISRREYWHGETTGGTPRTEVEREAYWLEYARQDEIASRTHVYGSVA